MKTPSLFKRINNIKMGGKLMLSYIVVVLLPVILVSGILITNMRQMVVDRALDEASVNIDRTQSRFIEVIKLAMDFSYRMRVDENLENLVTYQYPNIEEVIEAYNRYTNFTDFSYFYSRQIKYINFYTNNTTLLENGEFMSITEEIKSRQWFQKTQKSNGKICWQYIYDNNKFSWNLCLTSTVNGNFGNIYLGVVVIGLDNDYLHSILKNEPYKTIICNDQGIIIAASDLDMMGKSITETDFSTSNGLKEGISNLQYDDQISKAVVQKFKISEENGPFKIISIIPLESLGTKTLETAALGILIMLCSLLLAVILIMIFTKAFSNRIKRLSTDMHEVAGGNLNYIATIEGDDEFGQLAQDLEKMVKSIQNLISERNEVSQQKNQLAVKQREIKLKMLANQINPHFLFNALETIRMKAFCNGDTDTAYAVKLLGKIMRKNLEIGNELITLKSEVDMVISYLELQKFRYGDKITYFIEIDEEIQNFLILPLTIQPIVENAIIHGIEQKSEAGIVRITGERDSNIIKITIADNGVGMTDERLEHLRNTMEQPDDTPEKHVGMRNIYQRIKLCYGEGYGINVFSEQGKGTMIQLVLPGKGT